MAQVAQGTPGWAGSKIVFRSYDSEGVARDVATVRLHADGSITCDDAEMFDEWIADGIVGRASNGRLFPKDGQRFMDELPFMFKGVYLRAETE